MLLRESRPPRPAPHPPALDLTPGTRAPYSLRKGRGFWELTFQGQTVPLKHEKGILYVAWLLAHPPPEPIHGLDLDRIVAAWYSITPRPPEPEGHILLADSLAPIETHGLFQQRNLAVDDAESLRALRRQRHQLQALLDNPNFSRSARAQALRDLKAIDTYSRSNLSRTKDAAQRTVDAIRKAITRFHQNLAQAYDAQGNPHPVLRAFAGHLRDHLLIPSGRSCGLGRRRRLASVSAGCFTYEPPPGVLWFP